MKKLIALLCVLCMLVTYVPAMALDFGFGDLEDWLEDSEDWVDDEETDEEDTDLEDLSYLFEGLSTLIKLGDDEIEVHENFKNAMDAYVAFLDEYIAFLTNPEADVMDSLRFMSEYTDMLLALDALEKDESEMSDGDLAYYLYTTSIITEKLSTIE